MPARDSRDETAQIAAENNQMLATMVAMTLALGFWGVAALNLGEPRVWFFAAIAAVLTLTAFALMRPSSATATERADRSS